MDTEFITVEQLAKERNVPEGVIKRWVQEGRIPYHLIGGVIMFKRSELE